MTFTELLFYNDEFCFIYQSVKYWIISENEKRCIYEESTNKLIGEYSSNDDLLNTAIIKGQKLTDILEKIEVI